MTPVALVIAPTVLVALVGSSLAAGAALGWALTGRSRSSDGDAEVAGARGAPAPKPAPAVAAPTEPAQPGTGTARTAASGPAADDHHFERVLDDLPLGVVVADAGGRIVYRNAFAARFATGRHGDALVQAAIEEAATATLAGEPVERPIDLYGPPVRNLLVRATPTHDPAPGTGEPTPDRSPQLVTGAVVLVEDVTTAHQVERIRKDFVANVSHELRTPVGAIGVLAETLRVADDPAVVDRLAGRLHTEALRLGTLIEDLLALSRLESGRIEHPEVVDLAQVVRRAVERAAPAAEQREVTIQTTVTADAPLLLDGDQAQLVSAVANLLDNAVKYSEVSSGVSLSLAREGDEAVLSVCDTGVGIPESALNRIFERFYRVDVARSRATGGTGLGLSIVRHAVINHRGTISVSSVEGQGSTFTVRLPLSGPSTPDSSLNDERKEPVPPYML